MPESSFEQLYHQELKTLHAFLYRLGAPVKDVPDLIHDVFVTAIRKWSTYDAKRPVRPWLLGIAWRVHSDWKAKGSQRLEDASGEVPEQSHHDTPEQQAESKQAGELVQRALATLDETKRAVFVMHHFDGLSPNEISEAMNVPTATTYSRLRLARAELTTAVRELQGGGP